MLTKLFRKVNRSIFLKLLLTLFVTWFAISMALGGFYKTAFPSNLNSFSETHLMKYSDYLISSIGTPPDTVLAARLSKDLKINIAIEHSNEIWSSNALEKPLSFYKKRVQETGHTYDWRRGRFFLLKESGDNTFLFSGSFWQPGAFREELLVILALVISAILAAAYFFIRKIFRPIHQLNTGVEHISNGQLTHKIAVDSEDELGRLSESFNHMTSRVQQMISARERLLLDVSHEMRSPLTRMKVELEFLQDAQRKESLLEDLNEMDKMISEILEAERLASPNGGLELQDVNLAQLIRDVAVGFQNMKPGIQTAYLPESCPAVLDAARIKIVIKNLLENSLKYSAQSSKAVHVSLTRTSAHIFVIIKDFGEGIPAEHLPHIFDPFYRVDKSRSRETGGYGLGMSICKTIVEAHNGTIEIESVVDGGTTVTISLRAEGS